MTFVTCDLLDDNEGLNPPLQVLAPYVDGKAFANFGGQRSFAGQVVTVKCLNDNSRVKEQLANPGHGKVLVVDGGGSMHCALMGDLIAASAVANQWAGVIVYGCVRDVDALAQLPLGVKALGAIPLKSVRNNIGEVGVPLHFAGVNIHNGDYIYADNNGVVVSHVPLI